MPKVTSPVKKPGVVPNKQTQQKKPEKQEKPVKPKARGGRARGRISTPERKPVRKEPVYIPREEVKKKKGSCYFVFPFEFLWFMCHLFNSLCQKIYSLSSSLTQRFESAGFFLVLISMQHIQLSKGIRVFLYSSTVPLHIVVSPCFCQCPCFL